MSKTFIKTLSIGLFSSTMLAIPFVAGSCSYEAPRMSIQSYDSQWYANSKFECSLKWTAIYNSAIRVDEFSIKCYDYNQDTKQIGNENDTYSQYFNTDFSSYNTNDNVRGLNGNPRLILETSNVTPPTSSFAIQIICEIRKDLIATSDYFHFTKYEDDTLTLGTTANANSAPTLDTFCENTSIDGFEALTHQNGYISSSSSDAQRINSNLNADLLYEVENAMSIIDELIKSMSSVLVTISLDSDWEIAIQMTYHYTTGLIDSFSIVSKSLNLSYTFLGMGGHVAAHLEYKTFGEYKLLGAFKDWSLGTESDFDYTSQTVGNYLSIVPQGTLYAKDDGTYAPTCYTLVLETASSVPGWNNIYQTKFTSSNTRAIGDVVNKDWGLYIKSYWLKNVDNITPIQINDFNYASWSTPSSKPKIIQTNTFGALPAGVTNSIDYSDINEFNHYLMGYYDIHQQVPRSPFQAYFDNQFFLRNSNGDGPYEINVQGSSGPVALPYYQVTAGNQNWNNFDNNVQNNKDTSFNGHPFLMLEFNPVFTVPGDAATKAFWPRPLSPDSEMNANNLNFGLIPQEFVPC